MCRLPVSWSAVAEQYVWASICLQLVTFSKKMLPVVGKCSKNVSSSRQMLNFQYILSICLKLLTFSELSVDYPLYPLYVVQLLPKGTVIFKNYNNFGKDELVSSCR